MKRASRASPPGRIRHDFTLSSYAGELCPLCQKNRLPSLNRYPVCLPCQEKNDIPEDILESLKGYRFFMNQEKINWREKPPLVSGTIDNKPWQAAFLLQDWKLQRGVDDKLDEIEVKLIIDYLKLITPAFVERMKKGETKIRRRVLVIAIGTTVVTMALLWKMLAERQKKEAEE